MGSHPAGGVGPPERWRGAGKGGALTSGSEPRGAPPDPMLSLVPTGGRACGDFWSPCGSPAVPAPILLHLFKQESCPHFAEEEMEAQRSCVWGGVQAQSTCPRHLIPPASGSGLQGSPHCTSAVVLCPQAAPLCRPPPRPAWLPQETTPDRGHPWGELAALCHPSFSEGFLRLVSCLCFLRSEPRAAPLCCPLPSPLPPNRAATPQGSGQLSQGPRPPIPANTAHKAHMSPP